MSKPYDNQMRIPSDELEEMYQDNEHNYTPLKMLVTNCTTQKEQWIARNRTDEDVIIDSAFYGNGFFFGKWRMKKALLKKIKNASQKNSRI